MKFEDGNILLIYYFSNISQRLLGADQVACDAIRQEITISKQLSGHPHIVDFIAAAAIDKTQSKENRNEFLLLSELCTGKFVFFSWKEKFLRCK